MQKENKKSFSPTFIITTLTVVLLIYGFEYITPHPKYAKAFYKLGLKAEEKGREDKAIYFYQKAIRFNPTFAPAYNRLGAMVFKNGNIKKALEYFQNTIYYDPGNPEALHNLGLLYLYTGDYPLAVVYLQRSLARNYHPLRRYHLGLTYLRMKSYPDVYGILDDLKKEKEFHLVEQLKRAIWPPKN